jgi:hypothetical protein
MMIAPSVLLCLPCLHESSRLMHLSIALPM